jgi:antitoxin CptB
MRVDNKLRWQCRRGMQELDNLLLNYLDNAYPLATEMERQQFRQLLEFEDSRLIQLLLGGQLVDDSLSDLLEKLRNLRRF